MPRDGVYVNELNSGWFYVGSSGNIDKRIEQHKNSPVVSRHGGIYRSCEPITERQTNLRSWERDETLQRMMEHGINRVRGWEFQGDTLSLDNLNAIKHFFLVTSTCVVNVDFVGITKGVVVLNHVARPRPRGFVKLNAYKWNGSKKSLLATWPTCPFPPQQVDAVLGGLSKKKVN